MNVKPENQPVALARRTLHFIATLEGCEGWKEWMLPRLQGLLESNDAKLMAGEVTDWADYQARVRFGKVLRSEVLDQMTAEKERCRAVVGGAPPV